MSKQISARNAARLLTDVALDMGFQLRESESGLGVRGDEGPYERAAASALTGSRRVRRALDAPRGNTAMLRAELNRLFDKLGDEETNEDIGDDVREARVPGERFSGRQAIQDSLTWQGDRYTGGKLRHGNPGRNVRFS